MLMRFDPFRDLERWAQQLPGGTRYPVMPMDAYRHEAGVLTIRLPLAEKAKPRKVEIATRGGHKAIEAGTQAA